MQTRQRQIHYGGWGARSVLDHLQPRQSARGLAQSKTLRSMVALLASLGLTFCASAQTYSIDWFKISGGGGTSTGGVYAASGTIGQPDAGGAMSGGNYSLTGGFWSLIAVVQTPGAPTLSLTRSADSITISWPYPSSGWALEQNASITSAGGWQASGYAISTNASLNSITITAPTGRAYFRLHKP
jgi:hypothetical protein